MSAQHTPGRLEVDNTGYRAEHNGLCLMIWPECIAVVGAGYPDQPQEANARRLVACWNVCDGVPTEVLEAQQSGGLPWSVADQIEQRVQFDAYKEGSEEAFGAVVEKKRKAEERVSRIESTIQSQQGVIVKMRTQRDELLAALKQARGEVHYMASGMTHSVWRTKQAQEAMANIDAAIAKVEGGAA